MRRTAIRKQPGKRVSQSVTKQCGREDLQIKQKMSNFLSEMDLQVIHSPTSTMTSQHLNNRRLASTQCNFFPSVVSPRSSIAQAARSTASQQQTTRVPRFNEIPPSPRQFRNSSRRPLNAISQSEVNSNGYDSQLGIGIIPYDSTLVCPGLVSDKGDFYRKEFFSDYDWKLKTTRASLDMNQPQHFPLREPINFLQLQRAKATFVEAQREPIKRLCHDHIQERIEELEDKKRYVSERKTERKEITLKIENYRKERRTEIASASLHDSNAQITEKEEKVPRRIINKIDNYSKTLQPRIYTPYLVSVVFHDEETQEKPFQIPQSQKNPLQTVFIKLGEVGENNRLQSPQDTNFVQLDIDMNNLDSSVEKDLKPPSSPIHPMKREYILLVPKVLDFFDSVPHSLTYSEYRRQKIFN